MKLYKYFFPALLSGVLVCSCTAGFEEINRNPNGPTEVPPGLLIPAIAESTMDLMYSTFNGGDMGSCWAQHWAKVDYNDEERYQPRATQFGVIWNGLYAGSPAPSGGGILDANIMYDLAKAEGNKNLQGVALIMRVYMFSVLTDVFGDIPFTDAIKAKSGMNSPKYDKQEEIYPALLGMLDEANGFFAADGGAINADSDIIYHGDQELWQKFANALKFRLLMRMSSRADFNRQAELQDLISNRPLFTSNDEEAKLVYLAAPPNDNPVFATIISGGRGEYKINSAVVDLLVINNDPRLSMMAQTNNGGVYRGKPSGINGVPNATWGYANVSPIGEHYLEPTSPAYLMSYAEQEFLIAEAAKRGFITGGDATAEEHFERGVLASMTSIGVTAGEAANYLTNRPYNPATAITQIHTEKWISLFGQGIEAWTEWRRTGIPVLQPAIDGVINEIPSRYQYPSSEQSLNGKNYSDAVNAQGPDELTTKVWWMK